jgi:AcrR family transcriptional regulator
MSRQRPSKTDNATRAAIIDATETIMVEQGHTAVSSRQIAALAGIKSPLIHYYFDSMDDLFLEIYFKVERKYVERLRKAASAPSPLRELWNISINYDEYETKMMMEFIALSTSSPNISREASKTIEKIRLMEIEIIRAELGRGSMKDKFPTPMVVSFFITGSARRILHERELGISVGHQEIIEYIEQFIAAIEASKVVNAA